MRHASIYSSPAAGIEGFERVGRKIGRQLDRLRLRSMDAHLSARGPRDGNRLRAPAVFADAVLAIRCPASSPSEHIRLVHPTEATPATEGLPSKPLAVTWRHARSRPADIHGDTSHARRIPQTSPKAVTQHSLASEDSQADKRGYNHPSHATEITKKFH